MGNTVSSQALCEESKEEEKPREEQPQEEDAGSSDDNQQKESNEEDSGGGSGGHKAPSSPEPKNVGDDEGANAKETDRAQKQAGGAQASSKAGMSEPVSVRKDSQENAEANKEAHNASSGNRSLGGDVPAPDDEEHIQVKTVPYDPRFPATNQARNCYTRYNEYYKCISDKEEDAPECKFYQRAYRSLCPSEWVEGWNTQREEGTWFGKY